MAHPVSWTIFWRRAGEGPLAAAPRTAEDGHSNKKRGPGKPPAHPRQFCLGDRKKKSQNHFCLSLLNEASSDHFV